MVGAGDRGGHGAGVLSEHELGTISEPGAGTIAGPRGAPMSEQAARLQLFEYAGDLLCVAGVDGYFRLLNPAWRRALGWEDHELMAHRWSDFVHEADRASTEQATAALAAHRGVHAFENRYRRRDGSYVWLSWNAHSDPATGLIFAVAREVTEQRRVEADLHKTREDYRMLFEGMLDGFSYHEMIFDDLGCPIDYRFLAVNPAFEAATGLRASDLVGKRVLEILPGTEHHWIESFGRVAKTGTPMRFENYSREFEKYFECLAFQPRPGEFACTFHDVTARRKAEDERVSLQAQFLQAQKMESLGVLTGGIAHDFNNILTAVLVGAERARVALAPAHAARGDIDTIIEAAQRLAELCRQMLAYAGKSRLIAAPTDVSQLITGMRSLLEMSVSKKCTLVFDLGRGIPAAEADATQLRQLVLNLVINASDATGEADGRIAVSTGSMHCGREQLASSVMAMPDELPEGEYVFVEVRDEGSGMDQATLARIFDPFFTTKFAGRGLGLAAALGIVRGHHGTMQVRSEVGKGTVFRVLIPAVVAAAVVEKKRKSLAPSRHFSGVILLVDDEKLVRRVTERHLRSIGFEVLVAADGVEALEVFGANAARIRLALLDMTMPRLNGAEAAERILAIRPDLPIVFFSGYGEEEALARLAHRPRCTFLAKPFTYAELGERIVEALGEPTPAPPATSG